MALHLLRMSPRSRLASSQPAPAQVPLAAAAAVSAPNQLAAAPERICTSCQQSSHALDRDANPSDRVFVGWAKTLAVAGGRAPSGAECYRCYDVRRRFFALALADLIEQRKACKRLDERFLELRRDRVSGQNLYKREEIIDVSHFIKTVDTDFQYMYQEGTFHELWAFARQRRLPFEQGKAGHQEALVAHLGTLGLTVATDRDGVPGVEILDHNPGQYRFKRGKSTQVQAVKREAFEDKDLARDRCENLQAKHGFTSTLGLPAAVPLAQDRRSYCQIVHVASTVFHFGLHGGLGNLIKLPAFTENVCACVVFVCV